MTPESHILLAAIVGGSGAMLSYWAGWRARGALSRPSAPPYRRGSNPPPPGAKPALSVTWRESPIQRGNGNGGLTTPKPDIIPRPQSWNPPPTKPES